MNIQDVILLLKSKGVTQREMAFCIGCAPSNVSHLAHGRCGIYRPSHQVAESLKRLLEQKNLGEYVSQLDF